MLAAFPLTSGPAAHTDGDADARDDAAADGPAKSSVFFVRATGFGHVVRCHACSKFSVRSNALHLTHLLRQHVSTRKHCEHVSDFLASLAPDAIQASDVAAMKVAATGVGSTLPDNVHMARFKVVRMLIDANASLIKGLMAVRPLFEEFGLALGDPTDDSRFVSLVGKLEHDRVREVIRPAQAIGCSCDGNSRCVHLRCEFLLRARARAGAMTSSSLCCGLFSQISTSAR